MKIAALLSKISQFVFDIVFFIVLFKIIIDDDELTTCGEVELI